MAIATKDQERAALQKVRKIVEGLGEQSYLGTAMEGVWDMVEQNIEYDAAFSAQYYIDYHNQYSEVLNKHKREVDQLLREKTGLKEDYEAQIKALEEDARQKDTLIDEYSDQVFELTTQLEETRREVVTLKAAIYDLEHPAKEDIAQ